VSKDIFRQAMMSLADHESVKEVHRLLHYLYPDFEKAYRNYPNIEDLLNFIGRAQTFNSEEFIESDLWPEPRLEQIRTTILNAVTEYIWSFFASPQPRWRHLEEFFDNQVSCGDVVITFNWDLTVEQVLSSRQPDLAVAYQYSKKTLESKLTLLKPHGSINWFDKKTIPSAVASGAIELDPEVRLVNFLNLKLSHDLIQATPVIVPPVSDKQFDEHAVFQKTWSSVYQAIASATELIILGYSLPREDQFSRFVFRRALRNNVKRVQKGEKSKLQVTVVNPEESTEATFARLLGKDEAKFQFLRAYFQDYVDGLPHAS
jgi:hypothetical protein